MNKLIAYPSATIILLMASLAQADTTPPTLTVNNQIVECASHTTTEVEIGATVSDTEDPLPTTSYNNAFNDTDPDNYPYGTHSVTVTGCDQAGNCANDTVTVRIVDTIAPRVEFGPTIPTATVGDTNVPCLDLGAGLQCECNVKTQMASTITIGQQNFTTLDECDDAPNSIFQFPLGNVYTTGSLIFIIVYDEHGNIDTITKTMTIADTTAPQIVSSINNFTVVSQATDAINQCALPGGSFGTTVSLPQPIATDACTQTNLLGYRWQMPNGNIVASPSQCLANGTHTITARIIDGAGQIAETSFDVSVTPAADLNLSITVDTNPTGFRNQSTTVAANLEGDHPNAQWTASPAQSSPVSLAGDSVIATFSAEGLYCPLYLTATDGGETGATSSVCFAIDQTNPTHDFSGFNAGTCTQYYGDNVLVEFDSYDTTGIINSGVRRVSMEIQRLGDAPQTWTVLDDDSNCGTRADEPCPYRVHVDGCDSNLTGCENNRLHLATFGKGNFKLVINVYDAAGNQTTSEYPFAIGGLQESFANHISQVQALLTTALPNTQQPLQDSLSFAQDGALLFSENPGHGILMGIRAWQSLEEARILGAPTSNLQTCMISALESEGNRFVQAFEDYFDTCNNQVNCTGYTTSATCQADNACSWLAESALCQQDVYYCHNWIILDTPPGQEPSTREVYRNRSFLVGAPLTNNQRPKDYTLHVAETLSLASGAMGRARETTNPTRKLGFISDAVDSMVMLFDDTVYASLFERAQANKVYAHCPSADDEDPCPNDWDTTAVEAYFKGNLPATFGDLTAQTVSNQIRRFNAAASSGQLRSITVHDRLVLSQVREKIRLFSATVQQVQATDWDLTQSRLDNETMVRDLYLQAQDALDLIAQLPQDRIYTHHWRAGLALTLSYVINFSLYEGPASLYTLWGEGALQSRFLRHSGAYPINAATGAQDGTVVNSKIQTSECRYAAMMHALADGRIEGPGSAVTLFRASKCLMTDLYNENYGGGQIVATDDFIDLASIQYWDASTNRMRPCTEGYSGAVINFEQECRCIGNGVSPAANDTTCDGIDDDCDGHIDDDFSATLCGTGPCQRASACANGQELSCVQGEAPVTLDLTCNFIDDNCNGLYNEDWRPTICGWGECTNASQCNSILNESGEVTSIDEVICAPHTPVATDVLGAHEIKCDNLDNDCDREIDEGLDNDRDGYGCEPGANDCNRPDSGASTRCAHDNGIDWDCDDADPTRGPGLDEICDYRDNDCDCTGDSNDDGAVCGQGDDNVDEGVLNACGHCEPSCNNTQFGGDGGIAFNPTISNSSSTTTDAQGDLLLTAEVVDVKFAWIAVDELGRVAKIDTTTGKEVGRYCAALGGSAPQVPNALAEPPYGRVRGVSNLSDPCAYNNRASRTAVDGDGNVFVANRAFNLQASITKIANIERSCVDLNQNGTIDTSRDNNNNGIIDEDIEGLQQEYFGQADECILWTKKPTTLVDTYQATDSVPETSAADVQSKGEGGFNARAIALDNSGNVWLGNFRDGGFFELDPQSGKVKRWVFMNIAPYGAVVDQRGILWAPDICCGAAGKQSGNPIRSFNTTDQTVPTDADAYAAAPASNKWAPGELGPLRTQSWGDKGSYGIAIDAQHRVWVASYPQTSWAAARYEPATDTWTKALSSQTNGSPNPDAGMGRGVTVDGLGRAWVTQHGNWDCLWNGCASTGRLTAYNVDTMEIEYDKLYPAAAETPVGVGIGAQGKIWTANQDSNNLAAYDPDTGAFQVYPNYATEPADQDLRGWLYTYSDFTGNLFTSFTAPQGTYRVQRLGCFGDLVVQDWNNLSWTYTAQPAGTLVKVRVRVAPTLEGLETAAWLPSADTYFEASPADLSSVPTASMRYIEIEFDLVANDNNQSPILHSFALNRTCQGA